MRFIIKSETDDQGVSYVGSSWRGASGLSHSEKGRSGEICCFESEKGRRTSILIVLGIDLCNCLSVLLITYVFMYVQM